MARATQDEIKRKADKAEIRSQLPSTPTRGPGRPCEITDLIVDTVCARIAEGESLRTICDDEGMPNRVTINAWLDKFPEFQTKYARAREKQADVMDEKILAIADGCTAENFQATRVRMDAYKWRAARLAPKRYGDKQTVDVTSSTLEQLVAASYKKETDGGSDKT